MDTRSISAKTVNATVARALIDGTYLEQLGVDPVHALADMGWPANCSIDHVGLTQLAGFVCKMQHNDLWNVLPRTLSMIRAGGQELEVFTAYQPARLRFRTPLRQRAASFAEFLASYLADHSDEFPGGRDILSHEWTLYRVSNGWYEPNAPVGERPEVDWRPRLRGVVVIRAYGWDPLSLDPRPDQMGSALASISTVEDTFLCYFKNPDSGGVQVFRLDPLVALILGRVDGDRTPKDIARQLETELPTEVVVDALTSLASFGLVTSPKPESAVDNYDRSRRDPLLDALTGHAASRILYNLHRLGLVEKLQRPTDIDVLAEEAGVDAVWLRHVLNFLAADGGIVQRVGDATYVIRPECGGSAHVGFELAKFVGAYGACLDEPGPAPAAVNESALADAFLGWSKSARREPHEPSAAAAVLRKHGLASALLDLGCGPGDLLIELARGDPSFRGVGIDLSAAMCTAARRRAEEAGVALQVEVRQGDALDIVSQMSASVRNHIQAVHAASYFNALFGAGTRRAVDALVGLSEFLPGRVLVNHDYYGRLSRGADGAFPEWTLLQDVAQTCSGQGVPPSDRDTWESLYLEARCTLIDVYEGDGDSYRRFMHVIRLGTRA